MKLRKLNETGKGMYPLNYASRLIKEASDVMFSIAVDDRMSAQSRLDTIEGIIADLRNAIVDPAS